MLSHYSVGSMVWLRIFLRSIRSLVSFLLLSILTGFSIYAHADGYYLLSSQIEFLSMTLDDAYFQGIGNTGSNPDGCVNTNPNKIAVLPVDHPHFKEIYSMLLSAQAAKRKVRVYVSGCYPRRGQEYPKVVTVHLLD
jgi:hypothetical protein